MRAGWLLDELETSSMRVRAFSYIVQYRDGAGLKPAKGFTPFAMLAWICTLRRRSSSTEISSSVFA
jgi:hypothetical protein